MRNKTLGALVRRIVYQFGYDFCAHYKYPLTAFISAQTESTDVRAIASRGWSQEEIQASLRSILSQDVHLLKCCGDPWHLAQAIDILFLRKLSSIHFTVGDALPDTEPDILDTAIAELDNQLYEQGEFQKFACFHLFNVKFLPEHLIQPPYDGWVIKELDGTAVPRLLGESSLHSFISPPSTGTWFLICKDTNGFETERLYEWLVRRWKEAQPFRQVFQYAVDGILDIDYVAPHFSPDWVNEIQKSGLSYLGLPRQDTVPSHLIPHLTGNEQEQINRMWRVYTRHRTRIIEVNHSLRKALRIAGEFFEDYHRKANRVEQFTSLMIALEALFTPSDQAEQTFRISLSCALLACESHDSDGRQAVFEFLKKMFKRRGKLFHGQFDSSEESPDKLASDEEISQLASLVRKSILRLLTMYLQGDNDLEILRKNLQKAALDEGLRNELLRKGDYKEFMDDSQGLLLSLPEKGNQVQKTEPL
ncbi:MAG: HEPN domain-containing protein [Nitrospirae bacterium]|nr:HEPN domain-containing protein [Nitrospirota bacterium]